MAAAASADSSYAELDVIASTRIESVQISGRTLMKIIKYSADALLSGPLCGLLVPDLRQLEITDCFPTYTDDLADHQAQMHRSLREVNGDNNFVGWFRSTSLRGGFCDLKSVETHFLFEKRLHHAVYLVYDPVMSASSGSLALKALRFTDEFSAAYKDTDSSTWGLALVEHTNVFEEVPIEIYNTKLVQVFLGDLGEAGLLSADKRVLDLSSSMFFERTLQALKDEVDLERRLAAEEDRRFRGQTIPDTTETRLDRMNAILAGTHVRSYTKQLYRFAKQASDKLALASRLAEE